MQWHHQSWQEQGSSMGWSIYQKQHSSRNSCKGDRALQPQNLPATSDQWNLRRFPQCNDEIRACLKQNLHDLAQHYSVEGINLAPEYRTHPCHLWATQHDWKWHWGHWLGMVDAWCKGNEGRRRGLEGFTCSQGFAQCHYMSGSVQWHVHTSVCS